MANVVTLSGPVTAVQFHQNVTFTATPSTTGVAASPTAVHTRTTFRIANRPVSMDGAASVIDGDLVTAAGVDESDFRVIALRNDTTKVTQTIPPPKPILAVVFVLLGVVTLWLMLIGVIFIALGVGYWIRAGKKKQLIAAALAKLQTA